MNVGVAVVAPEQVPFRFSVDLANATSYTRVGLPDGAGFGVMGISGAPGHEARQTLLDAAREQKVHAVAFVGATMSFPKQAILHLVRHLQDAKYPMVGVNYAEATFPSDYTAVALGGKKLATTPESKGLEEVESIGFGLVVLRLEALARMPEAPWFAPEFRDGRWVGDEARFCELFRAAGGRIWVDHDLSKHCRQIGAFEYDLQHVEAMRG